MESSNIDIGIIWLMSISIFVLFVATLATVVSERVPLFSYMIYLSTLFLVIFRWVNDEELLLECDEPFFDLFIYSCVGSIVLFSAHVLGSHIGSLSTGYDIKKAYVLQIFGTLIIWFGLYGFKGFSNLGIIILSGIVGVKSCFYETEGAILIGIVSGVVYKIINIIVSIFLNVICG